MSGKSVFCRLKRHFTILLFIILYVFLAVSTYKDFGLTWDEPVNYNRGVRAYSHIFHKQVNRPFDFNKQDGSRDIQSKPMSAQGDFTITYRSLYDFCHYSGFYPMLLFMLNKDKSIDRYHLLNTLLALPVFVALYFVLFKQYRNQYVAIMGRVLLFLMPRFTGDIPANPKDTPFAVMYFISCVAIYCLASYRKSFGKILTLGLLFGISQNLRTVGITLYAILFIFDAYAFYSDNGSATRGWAHGGPFFQSICKVSFSPERWLCFFPC